MISVNQRAMVLVRQILEDPERYKVEVSRMENGVTVIDASQGSYDAGLLMGEICLGGLGSCYMVPIFLNGVFIPGLLVQTSHPVIALVGSQKAIRLTVKQQVSPEKTKKHSFMVSGPFRAISRLDKDLYDQIQYQDDSEEAVIIFESGKIPSREVMDLIAAKCKLNPEKLVTIFAPTNSIPGSVQIAARIIKTGLHILRELDFKPHYLKHAAGLTTIAPVAKDEVRAMGRTNDSLIYGGQVYMTVDIPKEEMPKMLEIFEKCPSGVSPSYGMPFYDQLEAAKFDFCQIDGKLFAPAVLTINNLRTGQVHTFGEKNDEVLWQSYF